MSELTNERIQRDLKRRERDADQRVGEAWAFLLSDPRGRRAMNHLLYDICGLNKRIWRTNNEMALLEGRRSVGHDVDELLRRIDPKAWLKMEMERGSDIAEDFVIRGAIRLQKEQTDE